MPALGLCWDPWEHGTTFTGPVPCGVQRWVPHRSSSTLSKQLWGVRHPVWCIACAAPQVHQSEDGTLLRVLEAVRRGRQLACTYCGRRGASLGCRVERCKTSMHVLCAQQAGATFYVNHCVACQRHARRFKNEPALDQ